MTRPLRPRCVLFLAALCLFTDVRSVAAQVRDVSSVSSDVAPAHVSFVEGTAALERDGRTDDAPANMPLLAGDRLRTASGRLEVIFADGSTLQLDAATLVDFQSDTLLRLLQGRVRLAIPGPARQIDYRIDTPSASAVILNAGDYRVAVTGRDDDVDLAVIRGAANLVNDRGRRELRAGEGSFARAGQAPSYPYVFNSAAWDDFDRWSEARRDARLGISTRYLPGEMRGYAADFDRYGSWRHDQTYGDVWYPTVAADWRPYYYGRWASLRPYGWTWIGTDRWAWPTHHYGRWGMSAGVWFWIPGRSWAPAWVSWAYAPGYVSWCPLGWNNHAAVQFANLNVHRGAYDPWRAWTVVPRQQFGHGSVAPRVVHADAINAGVRGSFVQRDTPPDGAHAVPRSSAPVRAAGPAAPRSPASASAGPSSESYARRAPEQSRTYSAGVPQIQRILPGYAGRPSSSRRDAPETTTSRTQGLPPAPGPRTPAYGARADQGPVSTAPSNRILSDRYPGYRSRDSATPADRVPANRVPSYTAPPDDRAAPRATDRYNPAYGVASRRPDSRAYDAAPPSQPAAPVYERRLPPQPAPRDAPRADGPPLSVGARAPRGESSNGQGAGVQRAVPRGQPSAPPQGGRSRGGGRGGD